MTTTRYPNGIVNKSPATPGTNMITLDPSKVHTYWNDFDIYTAGDFTVTGTGTGAIADGDGGWLVLTNDATDAHNCFVQLKKVGFTLNSNKQFYMKARLKVSDATLMSYIIGVQPTDTSPLATTAGVWFQKPTAAATLDFHTAISSTQTDSTAIATIATNTFNVYEIEYNGVDKLNVWLDGVIVAQPVLTNLPLATLLTPSFGIQNGEAVAKTMTIDYILVQTER